MTAPKAAGAPAEVNGGGEAAARDPKVPRSVYRDATTGALRHDLHPRELAEVLARGTGDLWVDVDSTNRYQLAVLDKVFKFHPLAVEDTLNPNSRVKTEEYDGYLFVIVRGVRFCEETTEDPYDIETFNTYFFLGPHYLVTVHGEYAPAISEVAERLHRNHELLARGVGRLMHAIMDSAVDGFFPITDQIEAFVDGLEERVFANFDQAALRDIFQVKRLVLGLRRHLSPQREVFNILTNRPTSLLTPETQVYFRDVHDHVLRINESLETYRDLLSSTLDAYLTQVSNRLGLVTKGLSVIATLSIPFVVVSGMWGMNFAHIPLSQHPHGFLIMLVAQVVLGLAFLGLLRWRKLL
jgi:magnesium transporter